MKNFFRKFVPIYKVDTAKRIVEGVMAEEATDQVNEIFDYDTSKSYVQKWSSDCEKRSIASLSVGNVRAMHGSIAAGKLTSITFDDAAKKISVTAHIVDDNEWKKVAQGVYTGFSIGGRYVKKWSDGSAWRYTAAPAEVSIVDNPCMYGASFTAVKADGAEEMRKFIGEAVRKSMWDIGKLATILEDLAWMEDCLECEAEYEGDNSTVPAQLAAWIELGTVILKQLVEEETAELTGAEKSATKENQAMTAEELKKMADLEKDLAETKEKLLKATPPPVPTAAASAEESFVKIGQTADGVEIFRKAEASDQKAELESVKKDLAETKEELKALNEGIQKFLAVPGKPTIVANPAAKDAASKSTDKGGEDNAVDFEKMSPTDKIKHIHAGGGAPEVPFRSIA